MQKNTAGKWIVFAFGSPTHATLAGKPITGDAANITANVRLDGGAANAVDDTNPSELEDGYYIFDITSAESNADLLSLHPASATADVIVIGVPGSTWTTNVQALAAAALTAYGAATATDVNKLKQSTIAKGSIEAIPFDMVDASDILQPGKTVTVKVSIDGGAWGTGAGTVGAVGEGNYYYTPDTADTNADEWGAVKFSATGCKDHIFYFKTSDA